MAGKPSEILRKTKAKGAEDAKKDNDKDGKKPRRNSLIDFIAKNKKIDN